MHISWCINWMIHLPSSDRTYDSWSLRKCHTISLFARFNWDQFFFIFSHSNSTLCILKQMLTFFVPLSQNYVQFMFAMLFFMSSHIHFIICLCIDLLFTLALIIMCCWPKTVFGVFVKKKLKKRLTCSFCSRKFGSSIDGGPFPTVHYYWTNKRRAFLLSSQTFFSSPPLSTSE